MQEWLALADERDCSPASGYRMLGDLIDTAVTTLRGHLAEAMDGWREARDQRNEAIADLRKWAKKIRALVARIADLEQELREIYETHDGSPHLLSTVINRQRMERRL